MLQVRTTQQLSKLPYCGGIPDPSERLNPHVSSGTPTLLDRNQQYIDTACHGLSIRGLDRVGSAPDHPRPSDELAATADGTGTFPDR